MAGRVLFRIAHACSHSLYVPPTALICPAPILSSQCGAYGIRQAFASTSRSVTSSVTGAEKAQDDLSLLDDTDADLKAGLEDGAAPMEPFERYPPGPADETAADLPSKPTSLVERPRLPGSIKKLNRLLGRQQLGEIPEHELKEQFVRGSGPGGQAINKTSSSVSLIHLPTGVRVQAQPTRSREANRKAARRILAAKLDLMIATGSWSRDGMKTETAESAPPTDVEAPSSSVTEDADPREEPELEGKKSRKETRKKEEVEMAGKWSRQEILWEKERRRKANRAKKSKKKRKEEEPGGADTD